MGLLSACFRGCSSREQSQSGCEGGRQCSASAALQPPILEESCAGDLTNTGPVRVLTVADRPWRVASPRDQEVLSQLNAGCLTPLTWLGGGAYGSVELCRVSVPVLATTDLNGEPQQGYSTLQQPMSTEVAEPAPSSSNPGNTSLPPGGDAHIAPGVEPGVSLSRNIGHSSGGGGTPREEVVVRPGVFSVKRLRLSGGFPSPCASPMYSEQPLAARLPSRPPTGAATATAAATGAAASPSQSHVSSPLPCLPGVLPLAPAAAGWWASTPTAAQAQLMAASSPAGAPFARARSVSAGPSPPQYHLTATGAGAGASASPRPPASACASPTVLYSELVVAVKRVEYHGGSDNRGQEGGGARPRGPSRARLGRMQAIELLQMSRCRECPFIVQLFGCVSDEPRASAPSPTSAAAAAAAAAARVPAGGGKQRRASMPAGAPAASAAFAPPAPVSSSSASPSCRIVMEWAEGGDLGSFLQALAARRGPSPASDAVRERLLMSEASARYYLACLLEALSFLHSRGLLHRDVKPANLLLASDGRAKLGDLGMACHLDRSGLAAGRAGTPNFMAPEVWAFGSSAKLSRGYGATADLWSAGVVLHELLTGHLPASHPDECMRPSWRFTPRHCAAALSPELVDLLGRMLAVKPRRRLQTCDDVRAHAWFAGFDWQALRDGTLPAPYVPSEHRPFSASGYGAGGAAAMGQRHSAPSRTGSGGAGTAASMLGGMPPVLEECGPGNCGSGGGAVAGANGASSRGGGAGVSPMADRPGLEVSAAVRPGTCPGALARAASETHTGSLRYGRHSSPSAALSASRASSGLGVAAGGAAATSAAGRSPGRGWAGSGLAAPGSLSRAGSLAFGASGVGASVSPGISNCATSGGFSPAGSSPVVSVAPDGPALPRAASGDNNSSGGLGTIAAALAWALVPSAARGTALFNSGLCQRPLRHSLSPLAPVSGDLVPPQRGAMSATIQSTAPQFPTYVDRSLSSAPGVGDQSGCSLALVVSGPATTVNATAGDHANEHCGGGAAPSAIASAVEVEEPGRQGPAARPHPLLLFLFGCSPLLAMSRVGEAHEPPLGSQSTASGAGPGEKEHMGGNRTGNTTWRNPAGQLDSCSGAKPAGSVLSLTSPLARLPSLSALHRHALVVGPAGRRGGLWLQRRLEDAATLVLSLPGQMQGAAAAAAAVAAASVGMGGKLPKALVLPTRRRMGATHFVPAAPAPSLHVAAIRLAAASPPLACGTPHSQAALLTTAPVAAAAAAAAATVGKTTDEHLLPLPHLAEALSLGGLGRDAATGVVVVTRVGGGGSGTAELLGSSNMAGCTGAAAASCWPVSRISPCSAAAPLTAEPANLAGSSPVAPRPSHRPTSSFAFDPLDVSASGRCTAALPQSSQQRDVQASLYTQASPQHTPPLHGHSRLQSRSFSFDVDTLCAGSGSPGMLAVSSAVAAAGSGGGAGAEGTPHSGMVPIAEGDASPATSSSPQGSPSSWAAAEVGAVRAGAGDALLRCRRILGGVPKGLHGGSSGGKWVGARQGCEERDAATGGTVAQWRAGVTAPLCAVLVTLVFMAWAARVLGVLDWQR